MVCITSYLSITLTFYSPFWLHRRSGEKATGHVYCSFYFILLYYRFTPLHNKQIMK